MQVSSLRDSIRALEEDLTASPMRISAYHDLPFAILRYDPEQEWSLRREVKYLATRLHIAGKQVHTVSLAELLWEAIDDAEGLDAVVELERERGFAAAQEQVTTYLSDPDWSPLPEMLRERLEYLDPERDVAFLLRAAAVAPAIPLRPHQYGWGPRPRSRTSERTVACVPRRESGAVARVRVLPWKDLPASGVQW